MISIKKGSKVSWANRYGYHEGEAMEAINTSPVINVKRIRTNGELVKGYGPVQVCKLSVVDNN